MTLLDTVRSFLADVFCPTCAVADKLLHALVPEHPLNPAARFPRNSEACSRPRENSSKLVTRSSVIRPDSESSGRGCLGMIREASLATAGGRSAGGERIGAELMCARGQKRFQARQTSGGADMWAEYAIERPPTPWKRGSTAALLSMLGRCAWNDCCCGFADFFGDHRLCLLFVCFCG